MNDTPTVSVITPVYNDSRFLADAIRSVQAQTLSDWEMIIVDDGSTDDSVEVADSFTQADDRIQLVKLERNHGSAVARNTAIDASNGRYIAFLDSDDQWLADKLDKQIEFMRRDDHAFTCTYYEKTTETGQRTGRVVRPPKSLSYTELLKSNRIGCLTVVYDSRRLGKVHMPRIRKRQDYGLWLKLLKRETAYCLPESLALYRLRSNSLSTDKREMLGHNWRLFRETEGLSPVKSLYYLAWNVARKISG